MSSLRKFYAPFNSRSFLDTFFEYDEPYNRRTQFHPKANVSRVTDGYQVSLMAPGFSKDSFDISVENSTLTITVGSEHNDSDSFESGDMKYERREFSVSNFKRSFILPKGFHQDRISASYESGILNVYIPFEKEVKKKSKIDVM